MHINKDTHAVKHRQSYDGTHAVCVHSSMLFFCKADERLTLSVMSFESAQPKNLQLRKICRPDGRQIRASRFRHDVKSWFDVVPAASCEVLLRCGAATCCHCLAYECRLRATGGTRLEPRPRPAAAWDSVAQDCEARSPIQWISREIGEDARGTCVLTSVQTSI